MSEFSRPKSMTIWPPDAGEDALYAVKVEWEQFDGRWEPMALRIATRRPDVTGPITGSLLRSLPIGQIVDVMRERHKELARRTAAEVEVPDDYLEAWEKGERPRLGVEHYQKVAEVYRAAFAAGASPTKVVAETFHVSTSTAASWVSRARNKHGLLPAAQMGKAKA